MVMEAAKVHSLPLAITLGAGMPSLWN